MSDTTPGLPKTAAEATHREYLRSVARVVRELRELADEVERCGGQAEHREGPDAHIKTAAEIVKRVASSVGYLGLDRLVRDAAKADLYQPGEAGP